MTRYNPDSTLDLSVDERDHADDVDRAMERVDEFGAVSWFYARSEEHRNVLERILGARQ